MEGAPPVTASSDNANAVQDTPGDNANAVPATPPVTKYKAKIYGDEREYTIDELTKLAQKAAGADERFRTAAQRDKAREEWLKAIKNNPDAIFEDLELNADEWAEKRLLKKLQLETMNGDQRRAYEAEQQLAKMREEAEKAKEEAANSKKSLEEREYEALRSKYAEEIDTGLVDAFKSTGKTATPRRIARVVEQMIAHAETHGEVLSVEQALERAESEIKTDISEILAAMSPEELAAVLPRGSRDGLRKQDLDELKRQNPLRQRNDSPAATNAQPKGKRFRGSTDDFFSKLEKKYAR
jgi:hypothetical protein